MSSALSIAVLPFKNMSSSNENEYFCDGLTEEIINALAKIKGLKVTSRTSSFFYKDKDLSITKIGKVKVEEEIEWEEADDGEKNKQEDEGEDKDKSSGRIIAHDNLNNWYRVCN